MALTNVGSSGIFSLESPSRFSRAGAASSPCAWQRLLFLVRSAVRKHGSVRNGICFAEDDFGESCPQKQKKPEDMGPEGILGVAVKPQEVSVGHLAF